MVKGEETDRAARLRAARESRAPGHRASEHDDLALDRAVSELEELLASFVSALGASGDKLDASASLVAAAGRSFSGIPPAREPKWRSMLRSNKPQPVTPIDEQVRLGVAKQADMGQVPAVTAWLVASSEPVRVLRTGAVGKSHPDPSDDYETLRVYYFVSEAGELLTATLTTAPWTTERWLFAGAASDGTVVIPSPLTRPGQTSVVDAEHLPRQLADVGRIADGVQALIDTATA